MIKQEQKMEIISEIEDLIRIFDDPLCKSSKKEDKEELVRKYYRSSVFISTLQKAFWPTNSYDAVAMMTDDDLKSCQPLPNMDFKSMTVTKFFDVMCRERASFGANSSLIYTKYLKEHPEQKKLIDGILSGNLYGLSADVINSVSTFTWIKSYQCMNPGNFREDFLRMSDRWMKFKKRSGSLVSVIRKGDVCEVLSRNGKPYRMFDELRKQFSSVPVDGMFQCQIYFLDENGEQSQKKFFSETAKKDQSTTFMCDVFDYVPLNCVDCGGATYEERRKVAYTMVKLFICDQRVSMSDVTEFSTSEKLDGEWYVIDATKKFCDSKPKNFMIYKK